MLVIQALGLELGNVLAVGGIGGLALGLAGREILENLLNGFLIMTTSPFEVRGQRAAGRGQRGRGDPHTAPWHPLKHRSSLWVAQGVRNVKTTKLSCTCYDCDENL